jgi:uncharacterized membrane protein YkoI
MIRYVFIILCLSLSPLAAAHADDDHDDDDYEARAGLNAAMNAAKILALSDILERVQARLEGRILEIEFEREDGRPIYEIYVLRKDGRRLEYEIDARTARFSTLKMKIDPHAHPAR